MKKAVSISIGSSKRNKAVEVTLLGEKVSIERIGTDGDMEAAERNATRVLAREARNATANLVIGMVRMTQQRYAEARDALLVAASADPRSPKPEYQLSLVYARMGDQASSELHLDRYREKLRAMEAAVKALHDTGRGGMD